MRIHAAAIAALFCCAFAPPVHAGQYTIDFSSLAGEAGQTIYSYNTYEGFFLEDPDGFAVIGPSNPQYDGSIGLNPLGHSWTLTDSTGTPIYSPDDPAIRIRPAQLGLYTSFALTLSGSLAGVPQWSQNITGTYNGGYFGITPGVAPVDAVVFTNSMAEAYQFASLIIVTGNAVPEPPSSLLGGIAIVVGAAAARARRRRAVCSVGPPLNG